MLVPADAPLLPFSRRSFQEFVCSCVMPGDSASVLPGTRKVISETTHRFFLMKPLSLFLVPLLLAGVSVVSAADT